VQGLLLLHPVLEGWQRLRRQQQHCRGRSWQPALLVQACWQQRPPAWGCRQQQQQQQQGNPLLLALLQ
jgi:hypothetical protein